MMKKILFILFILSSMNMITAQNMIYLSANGETRSVTKVDAGTEETVYV